MALYEIKHRSTGAVLFSLSRGSLRICVEAAVRAGANLAGADLAGADLAGADLARANLVDANLVRASLIRADLAGADLAGANLVYANLVYADLAGADLARANLVHADLAGADLIDAGQDRRGFRFWAWRTKEGEIVYRAGCHEWRDISQARDWYGKGYKSTGDRHECLARIKLLHAEALRRWPADQKQEAA